MVESTSTPVCYLRRENNPYHVKLEQFNDFVYLDHQAETNKGKWNEHVFKNSNPLIVEIGVGYGDFMTHYCHENPNHNYIGMDIRFKRSFGVAKKLQNNELKNVRFLRAQGQRVPWLFAEREVDLLFCFFPDPWPRKKQHKKRLFQKNLLDSLAEIIKLDGYLCFKTDHEEMFQWVLEQIAQCPKLKILWQSFDLYRDIASLQDETLKKVIAPMVTFQTKFEKIFLQQNNKIKALILCPLL